MEIEIFNGITGMRGHPVFENTRVLGEVCARRGQTVIKGKKLELVDIILADEFEVRQGNLFIPAVRQITAYVSL